MYMLIGLLTLLRFYHMDQCLFSMDHQQAVRLANHRQSCDSEQELGLFRS